MAVLACLLLAFGAAISGRVSHAVSNEPIRKATVTLTHGGIRLVAESDREGKFHFTGLPPGTYRLSAAHSAYLERPARRPVALAADARIDDIEIRLPPHGVIAGRVLDEDADPVDRAQVTVFRHVYKDGRLRWERLNVSVPVTEAGEYRFAGLTPGRYIVQARNLRPDVDNRYGTEAPKRVYVPAFYPNSLTEKAASPVEVAVGSTASGVDIQLSRVAQAPSVKLRGKVTGAPPGSEVSVGLVPGGANTLARPPDYAFELTAPAGEHRIVANVYSGGPDAYGSGYITLAADVGGAVLAMAPAPSISGRISVAEKDANLKLVGIRVALRPHSPVSNVLDARSDTSGRVTFGKSMQPGSYALDIDRLPQGSYVQQIKLGGQPISADEFDVQTTAALEIVLSDKAATISGTVADSEDKPFPDATVTLVSLEGKARPRSVKTSDDGAYQFTGIAPGKYRLIAWERADDIVWQDPECCAKYQKRAALIAVRPSETQAVKLVAVSADEMN